MRRWIFRLSVLTNALLIAAMLWGVNRLGGPHYLWARFRHDESALYRHRSSLFRQLTQRQGAVLMLGDSHIEQCEWQELLGDSLRILNRGITGDHTAGVLARLDDVLRLRPARVYLCVGLNDLIFGKKPQDAATTYREIVARIRRESPQTALSLISVPPVNPEIKNIGIQNADIQALNAIVRNIAGQYAIPYIDVNRALSDPAGRLSAAYTLDGVHLNGDGYAVWKKTMNEHDDF